MPSHPATINGPVTLQRSLGRLERLDAALERASKAGDAERHAALTTERAGIITNLQKSRADAEAMLEVLDNLDSA